MKSLRVRRCGVCVCEITDSGSVMAMLCCNCVCA